ncbi:MAG: patatin-like phospholipase family protein [Devosiaceae bacterium]|nr:patatin-like phospholipase family protein [Devosiaceae bacterium MH13]
MPGSTTQPSISLALGAGGARGLAHVHVVKALDDLGVKVSAITGTSIGAIVGAFYAAGMSGTEIEAYVIERFGDRKAIAASLWQVRARSFDELAGSGRFRIAEFDLEQIMERLVPDHLPARIEDLGIETRIYATRYYAHDDAIFGSGPLIPAMAASAAMAAVFQPVIIDGVVHIDGGATNPVPIDGLQDSPDPIVAVDVSGGPEGEEGTFPAKADALNGANQLMQRTIIFEKARRMRCDLLLQPKVGGWQVLDFMRANEVLKATEPVYEETKARVGALLDGVRTSETEIVS